LAQRSNGDLPEDIVRATLRARAEAMAIPTRAEPVVEFRELVVFQIGGRRYAIDASAALESITISATTILPGVPNFYRGLVGHRGVIYPLLDVRPLIGDELTVVNAMPAQAILCFSQEFAVAIAADVVEAFVRVDASAAMTDGTVVLDIWKLLADARLVVDDRTFSG
jgi:chemotaxis signal transduction protein